METETTIRVCWEFADGSYGYRDCATLEDAEHLARNQFPDARVWIGDEMVQQGFISTDDMSWLY